METQIDFVICPYLEGDMWKTIYSPLEKRNDVLIFDPLRQIKNKFRFFLFDLHKSYFLNKKHEIPFQSHWLKTNPTIKQLIKQTTNPKVFLIHETSPFAFSADSLKYLKKTFPSSKLTYLGLNPLTDERLLRVEHSYDFILTMVPSFEEKYGWIYHEIPYAKTTDFISTQYSSDVFFIGEDKGRHDTIVKCYNELTALKQNCVFMILNTPKEKRINAPGLIYLDKPLEYAEIVKWVNNSKALLEVVAFESNFPTLRTLEALTYEKRLITTNPSIKEQPYFSDRQINIISTPSDIKSIDWENFQPVPVPDCCKLDKYLSFLLSLS